MNTDHNLLFGVLALQADLIDAVRFAEACSAWAVRKDTSLADLLVERGWLTASDRADIEKILARKLAKHGGDALASLAEVSNEQIRQTLAGVSDSEVHLSLLAATTHSQEQGSLTTAYVPENRGRYTLSRLHKKGGIGQVWLARDGSLRRNVAFKELLPQHAGHPSVQARFLKEAQITGQLEHPGIVPIYEVGQQPDEQAPFYTMRFVHGRTLADAAQKFHRRCSEGTAGVLKLRELLSAFVVVCNTVAYAHSRGVIHRDLKPSNVALGDYGEVIVLDWGLARLMVERDPDAAGPPVEADSGPDETHEGQVLGTLAYMAPEQAQGRLDLLGPVTDVYGLGAILYVILTGQPPFIAKDKTVLLGKVIHEEPARPTSVAAGAPTALEAVCLKALAKQQADRYGSAKELAAEVQRWLADEPVQAYREPWSVRAVRWARRRRTLVVGTAVFLLSAVVALSLSTALVVREQRQTAQQKQQADDERDRAETNFEAARLLSLRLIEISEKKIAPLPQSGPVRAELLDAALATLVPLLTARPDHPRLQEHVALLHRYSANVRRLLGDNAAAERSYNEALRLWEILCASEGDARSHRIQLAETLRDSSVVPKSLGRFGVSAESLQRSVEIAESLPASMPGEIDTRSMLATNLLDLSEVEITRGRFEQAEQSCLRAIALYRELLAGPPKSRGPYDQLLFLMSLTQGATCHRAIGNDGAALALHDEAVNELRKLLKGSANDNVLHLLGMALVEQGITMAKSPSRYSEAEIALDDAITYWQSLRRRSPQFPHFSEWQAIAYQSRGKLRTDMKRLDLAAADLAQSRSILEGLVKRPYASRAYHAHLGRTYGALGRLALARKDAKEAAIMFDQAITTLGRALDQDGENASTRAALEEYNVEARRLKR
jgi:serine/threonine protein kinase